MNVNLPGCQRLVEVDAYREGRLPASDACSFERHIPTCTACSARLGVDDRLAAMGRGLAAERVSELSVRRVRGAVMRMALASPRPSRMPRTLVIAGGLAAIVGVVAVYAVRPHAASHVEVARGSAPSAAVPWRSVVTPSDAAVWSRSRVANVESVTLKDGWVSVHVDKLAPGERFLLAVPDGELEVHGTTFDVDVERGETRSVRVREGVVAVRIGSALHAEVRLGAGMSWPIAETPSALPSPSPSSAAIARPVHAPPYDVVDYAKAMRRYRAGDYAAAARGFHDFAAAHATSAESEDAAFLEAASLARAGRSDAAAVVAERFVTRYPRSLHRHDAAVLVMRAAHERHDCVTLRALVADRTLGLADGDADGDGKTLAECSGASP